MVTLINDRVHVYSPDKSDLRAEVISVAYGSCDLCGARCEASREYDGWTDWSQSMAVLNAISLGWRGQYNGRVRQLVCPTCQQEQGR